MSTQSLTLSIPSPLYEQLRQRAQQSHRSVEEETLEALATAVPTEVGLPAEFSEVLDSLHSLDEAALWETARRRLPEDVSVELEALHSKRSRDGLTEAESRKLDSLVNEYERHMLVRAQAAVLLKQRGHDVSELVNL